MEDLWHGARSFILPLAAYLYHFTPSVYVVPEIALISPGRSSF